MAVGASMMSVTCAPAFVPDGLPICSVCEIRVTFVPKSCYRSSVILQRALLRSLPTGEALTQEIAVKTVDRVAIILRLLSNAGDGGHRLSDIAETTGLGKTTAHRLLGALVRVGFANQDLKTKCYHLGAAAAALGSVANINHVDSLLRPALRRLARETEDTVFASVREGLAAVCIRREVGSFPIRTLTLDQGDRRPLGVGAGSLALLAFLPDDEIETIIDRNRRWLQDYAGFSPDELRRLVARTRADGYALNEGRIVPAMQAIGVPIFARDGRPAVALSIAAICDRMKTDRLADLAWRLREEADALAEILVPPIHAEPVNVPTLAGA